VTLLLDSNVLLDIFTGDSRWLEWSVEQIQPFADRPGFLLINGVIYAEISARAQSQEDLDLNLAGLGIRAVEPGRAALFRAGQAFAAYRDRGGPRSVILPDFIIGAHAAELGVHLVTRDPRRYRTYFPELKLISP
jgi:predicted nucleic acid-binding protein